MFIPLDLLREKAAEYGISLDEKALERFDIYAKLLVEWNEKINLTAITEPEEIVIKHFLDCLTVFSKVEIREGAKIIDVGTGAGFPGLVMLIARPDLKMTLMDSLNKRLNVIKDILDKLELSADVVHSRAEDGGQNKAYREKYDFSTARAVSNLRDLSEYCLPFVKVDGYFIALKGSEDEVPAAMNAIETLGGELESNVSYKLPNGDARRIVIIKKISQTPTEYPRKTKKITTKPL